MNPWNHAVLQLQHLRIALGYHEHLLRSRSVLYDHEEHGRTLKRYRDWLTLVRHEADEELAALPVPEVPIVEVQVLPEKSAGHVQESWRSGA